MGDKNAFILFNSIVVCFGSVNDFYLVWLVICLQVTVLIDEHKCMSSARRRTTTPTSSWVASKAILHLRKNSSMSTKELRTKLQEEHNCEIHYDTVWKGRQKALKEIHGSWEESFQLLFSWREEVMKRSSGSVIEIDIKEVDGNFYFQQVLLCTQALH